MKKITLLFIALFVVNTLFSQILYEEGIVKGKNVTYRVSRGKERFEKLFTYIQNVNNPDTTCKEVPERDVIPAQMVDLEAQLAVILHDFLSADDLKECLPGSRNNFAIGCLKKGIVASDEFFLSKCHKFILGKSFTG